MAAQAEEVRRSQARSFSRRMLLRVGTALSLVSGVAEHAMIAAAAPSTPASTPAASPATAVTVKMTSKLRFDPPQVTIKAGEAVTWVNDSPLPHTATGDPHQNPVNKSHPEYVQLPQDATAWGSKLLSQGEQYAHTFTLPGKYRYICIPHVLSGMRGTILVEK